MIKKGSFVPFDPPDDLTMDELLAGGARLCPKCFFPFVKTGGCDTMTCGKCGRTFGLSYAPVLTDRKGRRAIDVSETG
ncbi:hypothetical protein LTR57_010555 [Friedmanniomyces endolithicus]|uniref:E3 ubiquitin-protein ligase rnf14 n=1 Tax=Friedmanniomyces endolithicus TaxID=329885 RepID=A0AAN6J9F1_9PEZI|nr:E3 ubiquitin-protein ligase rnf14 [Friedmanniomyces endolithicus]KAK0275988.1 E3 ubiquitin-protein ligase rnf14 [Friedmanniomyces endolithicus]KAK0292434.1 E3 ubiquitin-protein ligase rnf14 [Friedmanniomyces endolithicus]KAK0312158.1 E3 ubiquitin-protein ligase rnf14 [Friedmanniomyces endolithicus]KAK0321774.1 E3 ubiquitin-protein ligase rnf14 [Friedmanniomyces endolithicus]